MIDTSCPSVVDLRRTIETHILGLYEADGTTLRAEASWPGKYTLPNGTSIPAVYTVGAQMVPPDWTIQGIECVIDDVPEPVNNGIGSVISIETWPVRFTNYGTSKGTTMGSSLLDIQRRLARTFPRDQVTYMARTEATYEALTARIRGAVLNPPIP